MHIWKNQEITFHKYRPSCDVLRRSRVYFDSFWQAFHLRTFLLRIMSNCYRFYLHGNKTILVEYWLQLKTETEHPGSNSEVRVYVYKACAKGIKTCARRNNIAGIICNQIFSDHPDLRETALFGCLQCEACLLCFWKPNVLRFQGLGDVQHSWLNVFEQESKNTEVRVRLKRTILINQSKLANISSMMYFNWLWQIPEIFFH